MYEEFREKIAGEIVVSAEPGKTIRKWRETFQISQHELSRFLNISPSMISDYESGRRKSPGVNTVRKIVDALIRIDERSGRQVVKKLCPKDEGEAILSIKEFPVGISASVFMKVINGKNLTPEVSLLREVYGYTVVDSIRAITTLGPSDFLKIFGRSSERALIFTGVKYGRSPMIAIRTQVIKPAMVIYVQPEHIDELAVRLAEIDNVLLVTTEMPLKDLINTLEKL